MERDDPREFSQSEFVRFIFGDSALGRGILGTTEAIARINASDLLRYKEQYYGPPNAVVCVVGPSNPEEIRDLLEEYLGAISEKQKVSWTPFKTEDSASSAGLITKIGIEQAHLYLGGLGFSYQHADFRAFELLHEILSHRLWLTVREERSLAYWVDARVDACSDIGVFQIYLAVGGKKGTLTRTLKIILEVMAEIKAGKISDADVDAAKTHKISDMSVALDGTEKIGIFFATQELLVGHTKTVDEIKAEIGEITRNDVLRLVQELWREENVRAQLFVGSRKVFPRFEDEYCKLRSVLR